MRAKRVVEPCEGALRRTKDEAVVEGDGHVNTGSEPSVPSSRPGCDTITLDTSTRKLIRWRDAKQRLNL